MAADHENCRGVVRGMIQQSTAQEFEHTAVTTPRMFAPGPAMGDFLASSTVAAGTVGAGAEMSPRKAGGYGQGVVGGGIGGRTPIEKAGGCQEYGHRKGGWSQIDSGPIFRREMMYRTCTYFFPWFLVAYNL